MVRVVDVGIVRMPRVLSGLSSNLRFRLEMVSRAVDVLLLVRGPGGEVHWRLALDRILREVDPGALRLRNGLGVGETQLVVLGNHRFPLLLRNFAFEVRHVQLDVAHPPVVLLLDALVQLVVVLDFVLVVFLPLLHVLLILFIVRHALLGRPPGLWAVGDLVVWDVQVVVDLVEEVPVVMVLRALGKQMLLEVVVEGLIVGIVLAEHVISQLFRPVVQGNIRCGQTLAVPV